MPHRDALASPLGMDTRHYSASRDLPFAPARLFDLVADVESYPGFVPGWHSARVTRRAGNDIDVEQTLSLGPLRVRFTSTATLDPPARITIRSRQPPFADLLLDWRFAPSPGGGCQVRLGLQCSFRESRMQRLADLLLARFGDSTLRAVERRAYARLGPAP